MKKLFSLAMLLMVAVSSYAQKDVTKFLGIPVDGTKEEMIQKLLEKGFTRDEYDRDVLEGEFNGRDVLIIIATNNNKVYRIMLADVNKIDESDIKIRFNKLCQQFENNPKYLPYEQSQSIPDNEDISYEMLVHNKQYEALFFQADDTLSLENMQSFFSSEYTKSEIENPTDEMSKDFVTYAYEVITHKIVWFKISKLGNKYYISMFYDNKYNQANGEDL
ncbi:MAG: hypothetical protein J1D86_04585 [Alistipes sp.]|nr:hypothetical protein [Alistipes sp.]